MISGEKCTEKLDTILQLLIVVGGASFVLALFLIISACVLMSKRGWNEWMKQLSPEKQLHSDWFSDGSLFFHEKRISLTMRNP